MIHSQEIVNIDLPDIVELERKGKLVLYGAGTAVSSYARIALWALDLLGLKPNFFIDDDKSRHDTYFNGILIKGPEFLKTVGDSPLIIVTSNYFSSIFKSCQRLGIHANFGSMRGLIESMDVDRFSDFISPEEVKRRMHTHYAKLNRILNDSKNSHQIQFNALDIQVTEKCTMKCLDCSNLMQYYETPKDIPIEKVIKNVELILSSIDKLADARLIGGEPFLNKNLSRLVDCLAENDKVEHITIYSNATFVPAEATLRSMGGVKKLHIEFTDYGALSRGLSKLPQKLDEFNISYFHHKPQNWTDSSRIIERNLNPAELSEVFDACCVNDALTLLGDRLYHCPFSANLYNLGAIDPDQSDWVEISEEDNPTTLRQKIHDFYYGKPFLNACRSCAGRDYQQPIVEPALQVKRFIPIHQRKEWAYLEHNNSKSLARSQ